MIVDLPTSTMPNDNPVHSDSPPAYESAIVGNGEAPPQKDVGPHSTQPKEPPLMVAGPPQPMYGAITSEAMVYHYQDPCTGQPVASLLPPDHPQMVCFQAGQHVPESRYGFLGVLAAIVWFPLGIGLCLLDRRVRCQRCGESLEDGLCS
ncbi:hypothetical protein EDB83DRAFT_2424966 [Lactarius deliciosus]|nr:hypothetical protein EDB83DRAFT_2424966 [Lactarius deliciosus]